MTNVKFRAWDRQVKQYVRIDSIQFDHLGNGEPVTLTAQGLEWGINRFVLEQWTGLKDKNGREIYEGDILHGIHEDDGTVSPFLQVIEWKDGFYPANAHYFRSVVSGNIHQNGELLK